MAGVPSQPATVNPYRRIARVCGMGAILIGIAGILGWQFRIAELTSVIPGLKPIAISASLVFIILGGNQILISMLRHRGGRLVLLSIAGLITLFGLLEIIQLTTGARVSIEDLILQRYPALFINPNAHIAPIASALVMLIGLGQTLYLSQYIWKAPTPMMPHLIGIIGSLVVLGATFSVLGYIYGTPFLLGRNILPISGLAALAGLLLGIGLVASAGDTALPLNQFSGTSTQARLLRAFLPLTALLLLLLSLTQFFFTRLTSLSPVIVTLLLITAFEVIIGIVIRQVALGIGTLIDQAERERRQAEEVLRQWTTTLEERVQERTAELEASNKEFEGFAYTVAHDLRSPLRSVAGFSEYLLRQYTDRLDARGQDYLQRMRTAALRMGQLIDDLLNLARISRVALKRESVNLSEMAAGILTGFQHREPDRQVTVEIVPNIIVKGDRELLHTALTNLLDNAWKFTRHRQDAVIAVGKITEQGEQLYYVRDNGVGFAMAYADSLFRPFHRLHTEKEYPGTGIGLAIVQRIIQRHGGRIWAESAEGQGATLFFTIAARHERSGNE